MVSEVLTAGALKMLQLCQIFVSTLASPAPASMATLTSNENLRFHANNELEHFESLLLKQEFEHL